MNTAKPDEAGALIKYQIKTKRLEASIKPIECVRETAKKVVFMEEPFSLFGSKRPKVEKMVTKIGYYEEYHDTWESAHNRLMEIASTRLSMAIRELDIARILIGDVKGMKL